MRTSGGIPCDVGCWVAWEGARLTRLWVWRLERALHRRALWLARPVVEGLARRIAAAVAVWRDRLASRLTWARRVARCAELGLDHGHALRSLSMAVRGVGR